MNHDTQTILNFLSYRRSAGSEGEQAFIDEIIAPFQSHENITDVWQDKKGNIFFKVKGGSDTLFTAHTDSCHSSGGTIKQKVIYDAELEIAYKDNNDKKDLECLGADDAAGVWLCLELLKAGVPSYIAFYREEEVGGSGSSHSATEDEDFYKKIKKVISFDRRGTTDVITHQGGQRCCSQEFAKALSTQLNDLGGFDYSPCSKGVFTDSANLVYVVPECTNVSVGYAQEHTNAEYQDLGHLIALRDALVHVEWAALPVKRDPDEYDDYGYSSFSSRSVGGKSSGRSSFYGTPLYTEGEIFAMSRREMMEAAWEDPEFFAASIWAFLNADSGDYDEGEGYDWGVNSEVEYEQ